MTAEETKLCQIRIAQALAPFFIPGGTGHDSTALDRAVIAAMDAIGSPSSSQPVTNWPLKANVWKRESTQEWVLEIEGVLGETNINCRHTQPLSVAFADVPGLPTLYREPVTLTDEDIDKVALEATGYDGFGTQPMNSHDLRNVVHRAIADLREKEKAQ